MRFSGAAALLNVMSAIFVLLAAVRVWAGGMRFSGDELEGIRAAGVMIALTAVATAVLVAMLRGWVP